MKLDKDIDIGPGKESGGNWSIGTITLALILVMVTMLGIWHFANRKWIGPTYGADVAFLIAPEKATPKAASRFVVHVEEDNTEKPLPGRIMDVEITPMEKAQIVSVSGASGTNYAAQASRAKGRTDSAGNLDIMVSAREPGKYTIVATDSASLKEATVNFRVEGG